MPWPKSKGSKMERFWRLVDKKTPNQCWNWIGAKGQWGYGRFRLGGALGGGHVSPHRFVYEEFVGPIPRGLLIMHSCDNPACVNPKHLKPGTCTENASDAARKGRMGGRPTRRLSDQEKSEIMKLFKSGVGRVAIARRFKTSAHTVRRYTQAA